MQFNQQTINKQNGNRPEVVVATWEVRKIIILWDKEPDTCIGAVEKSLQVDKQYIETN